MKGKYEFGSITCPVFLKILSEIILTYYLFGYFYIYYCYLFLL